MTEYLDTFCPECDAEVRASLSSRPATLCVRGADVTYPETVAICPTCGATIGDARIEGENLERAYATYRSSRGILSPAEIKGLRQSFGLSLREFSKYLGFGEQTAYRYEHGDLPDQSHNTTMLSAKSVDGARLLLAQNASRLSERSIARVEQRIRAMADGAGTKRVMRLAIEEREADAPSAANGYRRLEIDRVVALAFELARRCDDLYWTKLQKAMFFADTLCFERFSRSLTGMSYAHATYGPVMDRKDEVRLILVERGTIEFRECGWGELLVPLETCAGPFSAEELSLVDEVSRFVNTFGSARELSDFSHGLESWSSSADGQVIEYTSDRGEVGAAMAKRMERLCS